MEQQCPICTKTYKGKIGVGVHLIRSHTADERSKLYMKQMTEIVPILLTTLVLLGATKYLQQHTA